MGNLKPNDKVKVTFEVPNCDYKYEYETLEKTAEELELLDKDLSEIMQWKESCWVDSSEYIEDFRTNAYDDFTCEFSHSEWDIDSTIQVIITSENGEHIWKYRTGE
jgi:hypothetical protein